MGRGRSGKDGENTFKFGHAPDGPGDGRDTPDFPSRVNIHTKTASPEQTLEAFRRLHVNDRTESAFTVDEQGFVTQYVHGGATSVGIVGRRGEMVYHNHPSGGAFSTADLNNFANYGVRVYRAAAPEGTYSISKGRNFDSAGLKRYYAAEHAAAQRQYRADVRALGNKYSEVTKAYRAGTATRAEADRAYKDYQAGAAKAFNKWLVSNHNALIAGQRQYGYTYSLERRE